MRERPPFQPFDFNSRENIDIQIQDEEGNVLDAKKIAKQIVEYTISRYTTTEEANNEIVDKIFPLSTIILTELLEHKDTQEIARLALLSTPVRNTLLILGMCSSVLIKYLEQNKLKMTTIREKITEEELASNSRCNLAMQVAYFTKQMGLSTEDVYKHLYKIGELTEGDLRSIGIKDIPELPKDDKPKD